MARRKNREEPEKTQEVPAVGAAETSTGTGSGAGVINRDDDTTEAVVSQVKAWDGEEIPEVDGGEKGRNFGFVVYPTREWMAAHYPDCQYDGRDGWGSAPDDWVEQLRQTGLPFAVSPLHWLDTYLDASTGELIIKKPHWHVIVSWGNSTTYRSAAAIAEGILHGPRPIILRQVVGYYRYFNHADNPEKYQYEEPPVAYNGWERPVAGAEALQIMRELTALIFLQDCEEYAELVIEAMALGPEYQQVAERQTLYLSRVCDGYRWSPVRVLRRFMTRTPGLSDDERDKLAEVMKCKQAEAERRQEGRQDRR